VGLLSAAALHGAAHQQPQELQVITVKPLRPVLTGRSRIRFFVKKDMDGTATIQTQTETGAMRVSSPEATALDLVRYARGIGGPGRVATVLAELSERLSADLLVKAAKAGVDVRDAQRLGFLLDRGRRSALTDPLAAWVRRSKPRPVLLRSDLGPSGGRLNDRWQVIVNETVESDL
jgi:hypothetical protein